MRVEAVKDLKSDGRVLAAGDIVTVPDEIGARWCAMGWAVDPSGTVPTGERKVLNARLAVDSIKQAQRAKTR